MNASELTLNAMLVASACDAAEPADEQDEHREAGHVEQHLETARPAVVQDAAHERAIEPQAA